MANTIKVHRNARTGEVRVTFSNGDDAELVLLAAACRLHETTGRDSRSMRRRELAGACSIASTLIGNNGAC